MALMAGSTHLTRLWSRLNEITQQSLEEDWMERRDSYDPAIRRGPYREEPFHLEQAAGGLGGSGKASEDVRGGLSGRGWGWRREPAANAPPHPPSGAALTALWWPRMGG